MTNAEKFKEVFGFDHKDSCPVEHTSDICKESEYCDQCDYYKFWSAEYKASKKNCCGNCKYCKQSGSIFDVGVGYCIKTDEITRVNLWASCDEYEEGDK